MNFFKKMKMCLYQLAFAYHNLYNWQQSAIVQQYNRVGYWYLHGAGMGSSAQVIVTQQC